MRLKIAVASNFAHTFHALKKRYEESTGQSLSVITGSSGKIYAQILSGAKFDIFFSADSKHPELLEKKLKLTQNRRYTYAVGQLVLWTNQLRNFNLASVKNLQSNQKIALANPLHAPYGQAAKEVLIHLNLWEKIQPQLVFGENIAQTYQFIETKNVQLGFIALSQLKINKNLNDEIVNIPDYYYKKIEQQLIQLNVNKHSHAFLDFIQSNQAKKIIQQYGYNTDINK